MTHPPKREAQLNSLHDNDILMTVTIVKRTVVTHGLRIAFRDIGDHKIPLTS